MVVEISRKQQTARRHLGQVGNSHDGDGEVALFWDAVAQQETSFFSTVWQQRLLHLHDNIHPRQSVIHD